MKENKQSQKHNLGLHKFKRGNNIQKVQNYNNHPMANEYLPLRIEGYHIIRNLDLEDTI